MTTQKDLIPTVVEGESINITEMFLDEWDEPIYPSETTTGPEVVLYDNDQDRSVIATGVATPGQDTGSWQIDFAIPVMDILDDTKFQTRWTLVDDEGDTHTLKNFIIVQPGADNRISDSVYIKQMRGIGNVDITVPLTFNPDQGDKLYISAYKNNIAVFEGLEVSATSTNGISYTATSTRINIRIKDCFEAKSLAPYNILIQHEPNGAIMPRMLSQNLWVITPQVMVAANQIEAYINKAKLENVIPSLQYTVGDIMTYLFRGLNLFNQIGPMGTSFTGMNMQGPILDSWITCACYYALGSQLQAEGALAFDFSGQTVSLNIDRTPQIEGALGRVENQIETNIKPYKKLLVKAGVTSGDGSQGANSLSFGNAFGAVTITNSPVTNLGYGSGPGRALNGWVSSPKRGR
ncbi:Phage protein [Phage NCTB]|nr:Phage protein [Phage NCTB]